MVNETTYKITLSRSVFLLLSVILLLSIVILKINDKSTFFYYPTKWFKTWLNYFGRSGVMFTKM